jgi:hypothetical protein
MGASSASSTSRSEQLLLVIEHHHLFALAIVFAYTRACFPSFYLTTLLLFGDQHADDNLKMDSSDASYKSITLLQGNIGSAIELGTYGIGIR